MLEPVQGEGGFIPMPRDFPGRLQALLARHGILYVDDEVQSGVGRTGPVWAIEHYSVEPDLVVSGKSLGGGLPLAGVTGRADVMDAPHPGGLGGTFGGSPLSCAAAVAVLDEVASPDSGSGPTSSATRCARRLEEIAERVATVGEVRGLGPMLALELVTDRETKEPAGDVAKRTTELARERGLVLLDVRSLRQRRPHPRADPRGRRGRGGRALDPGGGACRRKRRSVLAGTLRRPASMRPTSGS